MTTEHGSVIYLDADASRWIRIPAMSGGDRPGSSADHQWRRLLAVQPDGDPYQGRFEAEVGRSVSIYTGMTEWWTTSKVVRIERVERDDAPAEIVLN